MVGTLELPAATLMGWMALAILGAAAMGLIALRVPRTLWSLVGAALMIGAAGYAVQGRPGLAGHDVVANHDVVAIDPAIRVLRDKMLGRFTGDGAYMIAADAMERIGDRPASVQVILGGIRHVPTSVLLWTGLGTALASHDGGVVSPPSLFAFQQATRLSPQHPGPPFFEGLAYVRSGDFTAARVYWARALKLCPRGASYCRDIAVRLALLDRVLSVENTPAPAS